MGGMTVPPSAPLAAHAHDGRAQRVLPVPSWIVDITYWWTALQVIEMER